MSAFDAGQHAVLWTLAAAAGALTILAPLAVALLALRLLWTGPAARAGWRIKAWRLARRLRTGTR